MEVVVNARFLMQPITGVQRFAIEISKELIKNKYLNIQFVTPNDTLFDEELGKELKIKKIGSNKGHLWEQYDLPKYLKSIGSPILVNLCNTAPIFYSNKISTIHDVAFLVYPNSYSKAFLYFYKILIPNIISTSKKIITVSEFSKKEIIKYYKTEPNKIAILNNSINSNFKSRNTLEKKHSNFFLAVSSLSKRKNFESILLAFEKLVIKYPNFNLYVVGDLKTNSFKNISLEKYISNKSITFLGRLTDDELIEYYKNAFAFIYPSFYEGFGIPPLEAQSCGCPVIASDVSSLPEVLQESAIYCDPLSIDSLLDKMELIINNDSLRENLINKGFENVLRFSWEKSSSNLISIINSLINK